MKTLLKNKKGAALLTVLIALMIITLILFEFQYETMVDRKLAYNELEQLQTYYLAKGAARLGLLRVILYFQAINNPNLKKMGVPNQYLNMIWNLPFPAFPPQKETIAKLNFLSEKEAAQNLLKQTRLSNGEMSHFINTESSKINLNFLQVPKNLTNESINFERPTKLFEYVGSILLRLIERIMNESENRYEKYGNIKPLEIVYNIMDWVNAGSFSFSGGDKDSFYTQQDPPYKAKRNRFYTVDELKLIKGITPTLFKELRKYVTVNSYDGRININNASREVIRALYSDFTEDDLAKIEAEKARLNGEWQSEKQFVDFIVNDLGRFGFKDMYPKPEEYPFTVSSQGFTIEGSGRITKSASVIQKTIKVAVALTTATGSSRVQERTDANNAEACQKLGANYFWDNQFYKCFSVPTSNEQCKDIRGDWVDYEGRKCCKIVHIGIKCPPATSKDKVLPNKIKVLYWIEM